ncbi:hypothetical protein CCR94_19895 [Rhodoblastus sphagnicola]|uniref:Uncharacterized protein n=1 Tax=Rhodoblastus sphagnicola TaxID=333368 RepID=A0A2S6MYP5_9HYPH|nr:hypothetical protein [Rhodoblastus sphagnicola]MBB4196472.1 hypothetical protein [Rhodoblastus sphagnicola]PPQ27493.1 hypothetical protein CCR94_19895 [Rhodoblastus sphagnicola]
MRRFLLLLGFAPALLVLAGVALWRLWPSPPPPGTVEVTIGAKRLHFTSAYLREVTEPDRADLVVLAPDFAPAAADPRRLPGAGEADKAGAAQIFITLTPASGEAGRLAPADRYAPHLTPDVQVGEGGLLRRRFEDKSPFPGEDFYYSAPDGEEFSARCQRPKIPDDGLPEVCLAHFAVEGVDVALRFDPRWLPQWAVMRANALLLTRGALAP